MQVEYKGITYIWLEGHHAHDILKYAPN